MERGLNSFDQQIRQAYESGKLPAEAEGWDVLSHKLDHMAPSPLKYFATVSTGIVVVGMAFLVMLYFGGDGAPSTDPAIVLTDSVGQGEPAIDTRKDELTKGKKEKKV
jgi:hypothetical protein